MCLFLSMVVWRGCFLKWISGWMPAGRQWMNLALMLKQQEQHPRVLLRSSTSTYPTLQMSLHQRNKQATTLCNISLIWICLRDVHISIIFPQSHLVFSSSLPITCSDEYFVCFCVCMYEGVQEKGWKGYPKKSEYRGLFNPTQNLPLLRFCCW